MPQTSTGGKMVEGMSLNEQAVAHRNLPPRVDAFLSRIETINSAQLLVTAPRIIAEVRRRLPVKVQGNQKFGCLVLADGNANPDVDIVSHDDHEVELSTIDHFLREREKSPRIEGEEWIDHIAKLGG